MKKLWGIRHVRYFLMAWGLQRHLHRCARMGIGFFAQQSDIDYLNAVYKGEK